MAVLARYAVSVDIFVLPCLLSVICADTILSQNTPENQTTPQLSTRNFFNISSDEEPTDRASQPVTLTFYQKVPRTTTELHTLANWSTTSALNMSNTEPQFDQTSESVTFITDKTAVQYTTDFHSFTDGSTNMHSSTTTKKQNYTVVVYIIQLGCVFLLSVFVIMVVIVTLILYKRQEYNSRASQSDMNNIPTTELQDTSCSLIHIGEVSTKPDNYSEQPNEYQVALPIPDLLDTTCNGEMSQDGFPCNLQVSEDIYVIPLDLRKSKVHETFSRIRQKVVKTRHNFRQSFHFNMTSPLQKPEEVAYCTTTIDHDAFTYDTPRT